MCTGFFFPRETWKCSFGLLHASGSDSPANPSDVVDGATVMIPGALTKGRAVGAVGTTEGPATGAAGAAEGASDGSRGYSGGASDSGCTDSSAVSELCVGCLAFVYIFQNA